jgi:hypothetical protein
MRRTARICPIVAFLVVTASIVPARAESITVGELTGWGSCNPFGCKDVSIYQQVYAASLFPNLFGITGVDFFNGVDHHMGDRHLDPAYYEVWLSTTSAAVDHLSTTDLASNRGENSTRMFAGRLGGSPEGELPPGPGSTLPFTWTAAFNYDPRAGNLLLEIRKTGGSLFGDDGVYLDFDDDEPGMSLVSDFGGGGYWSNRSAGLITRFNGILGEAVTPAPIPEPATMLMLGTGLFGAAFRAARRGRRLPTRGSSQETEL